MKTIKVLLDFATFSDGMTSGSVKLVAKAIDKAGSYIFQMAKDILPSSDNQWLLLPRPLILISR
ncbi:MAG: hypothetical protein ACO294_05550 [Methylococcales bacterium]|jgi:hypothetical protein